MNFLILTAEGGWAEGLNAKQNAQAAQGASGTISHGNSIGQLLLVLFVFFCVVVLCYYVTRYLAGIQKVKSQGKNIQILEVTGLASGSYLQLVKVGKNKYYVLAVSKDSVTKVGELSEDDILEGTEDSVEEPMPLPDSFKVFFDKVRNKNQKQQ